MSGSEESIRSAREGVDAVPKSDPRRPLYMDFLAIQLYERYTKQNTLVDIEEAVRISRDAVDMTPHDRSYRIALASNLLSFLRHKYLRTEALADLEEAIETGYKVLSTMPKHDTSLALISDNLASQLVYRFLRTNALDDLEESIRLGRDAIRAIPEALGDPRKAGYLTNLCARLAVMYERKGEMSVSDLQEAIDVGQQAVELMPKDDPGRAMCLSNLAKCLGNKFQRTERMDCLEKAIRFQEEAVNATPKNHIERAGWLNNLAYCLRHKYIQTGKESDIDHTIEIGREAVNQYPQDHPDRRKALNNLGNFLGDKYERTKEIADLDEAIQIGWQLVNTTSGDHPDQSVYFNSLALRLGMRYQEISSMVDLEAAIPISRQAVDGMPKESPMRLRLSRNLATLLAMRYQRKGADAEADLKEAIQILEQIVSDTPETDSERAAHLESLGNLLLSQYKRSGTAEYLERAIQVGREAISATPEDHSKHAKRLVALGVSMKYKYWQNRAIADITEAIRLTQQAVDATPEDHPDLSDRQASLGEYFHCRYLRTEANADLEAALSYLQIALCQPNANIITRINAGRKALECFSVIQDWNQAYGVAENSTRLIPLLTPRALQNADRQHLLGQVATLASDAAAVALNAEKGPMAALDLLEYGRGVLTTALEEMRVDDLELREQWPDLAEQFARLTDELERPLDATDFSMKLQPENGDAWKDQIGRRVAAGAELDELINNIRERPGFENFLLPLSETKLREAARPGPVVIINTSKYRCDAILVEQHRIRALPLPHLKTKDLAVVASAKRGKLGGVDVLEWLWNVAVHPVLDALGFEKPASGENWPHVWWVPTGLLTLFPLHAAGHHESKGSPETVLDRVVSSYSSSVKGLVQSRNRPIPLFVSPKALLVAMPTLPSAIVEISTLRDLCKSMGIDPIEPERRQKSDVALHLTQCKIFHFAGHGYSDHIDPSRSHLLLGDREQEPLTVAALLETNIRQHSPFLAYLSACATGQILDEKSIDESIHLMTAFQLAGFRHVIGTLWEVDDSVCVDVARIVYEGMRDSGITDESIARGLHRALRELRDRWSNEFSKPRPNDKKARVCLTEDPEPCTTRARTNKQPILPRDGYETDEDEEHCRAVSLPWVPYVHFGV